MQTMRDAEIVEWIGRLGAAGAEHVMGRFEMRRDRTYTRLGSLRRDGLLEQRMLLHRRPGLYVATLRGLRWRGIEHLGVQRVNPGGFEHAWEVAETALALHRALPGWEVISEREIRSCENQEGTLLASAKLGELAGGGRPTLHRPDLALISPAGRTWAIEVELSVKAPARLRMICRSWARAGHLAGVFYLAAPQAGRAVKRAVLATRAEQQVFVLALDAVDALAAAATKREVDDVVA